MANDLLHSLIRANLAGTAVALILLALRGRLRKKIGPTAVYALWMAVPAAALASLLPSPTVVIVLRATPLGGSENALAAAASRVSEAIAPDWSLLMITVWAAAAIVAAGAIAWRHCWFLATIGQLEAKDGVLQAVTANAGPAVIGLISPRILIPSDFETRFSLRERSVILAHETIHLARGDSRINAVVLMVQCLSWFNPVAHIAARALRLDQELACDAGVMRQFPLARRSYAEAMLKSQIDPMTLPIGCYWQAKGASALSNRLALLHAAPLSRRQMATGLVVALLITSGAGLVGWAAQPARRLLVVPPDSQTPVAVLSGPTSVATAPRSLPIAAPSLRLSRPAGFLKVAEKRAPDDHAATLRTVVADNTPSMNDFQFGGMPMPPDPDSQDADDASPSIGAPYDNRIASGGHQAQTVSTYRNGLYLLRSDFTSIDDKVQVSTELYKGNSMIGTGTATTRPGETAYVSLSNGLVAQVAPGKTAYLVAKPASPPTAGPAPAPS
jgi:beta-lactamase regulating signal transducer with metallopeptidase domain